MDQSSIRPEPKPQEDAQARQELRAAAKQELEADRQTKEHRRQEKLRDIFACGVRSLLLVVFLLIAAALVIVAWHYLATPRWHWMSDDALGTVSTALFSGTLFVFLGLYVRDRV